MALDETLLHTASKPILRVYCWDQACLTIGYFEKWADASKSNPELPITRRWTGGGTVVHGTDWPYSLIVPYPEPLASVRPSDCYKRIHSILARIISTGDASITLACTDTRKVSSACFENPVMYDLLGPKGKIAGAGQRRSKRGFLHQGSVQLNPMHHPAAETFALALSLEVRRINLDASILSAAESLCKARYSHDSWLQAR